MILLENIIKNAYENLPIEKKSKPWTFVNHGVSLLQNEDELNCYLSAYGKMHEEKIHTALSTLVNSNEIFGENFQVIDWGCGQGLATLCLIDYLNEKKHLVKPSKITLIEPSVVAIKKANIYLKANLEISSKIELIIKTLDDVVVSDVEITEPTTINFFSNILDIEAVNLEKLTSLIKRNLKGEQYFICVGPLNATSTRIDIFAKLLNFKEEQIIGKENGKLKSTRGTIKLLVFKITGEELQIIKSLYYPPMPQNKNYLHILKKKLALVGTDLINPIDKVMEYFKLVVELEQIKEPAIDKFYNYNYEINENNEFWVDLISNNEFLKIFNINRDPTVTRFPKDLYISVEINIDDKKYSILNYTYLSDDIKDINTSNEKIKLKLNDFEINYSTLTNFEKTEEDIDEIEKLIKAQDGILNIINIFKQKLDKNLTFDDKLSFALSSKNPALSQIYSELKRIDRQNVKKNSLLYDFLLNTSFENKIDNLNEDDLIQLNDMDASQKKAVLNVFNNKLTVITGPPGSGKTQVISNILANAVMLNKRVLVASKNNQAVDNVKSRFERDNDSGFFLRFGSTKVLKEVTIPEMNRIITFKNVLENNIIQLKTIQDKINQIKKIKNDNKKRLELRIELQSKLPNLSKVLKKLNDDIQTFRQHNEVVDLFRINNQISTIDTYMSNFKRAKNTLELRYVGLAKIWFNWFRKRKAASHFINSINETPLHYRTFFKNLNIPNQISDFKNGDLIIDAYKKITDALESIIDFSILYDKKEQELKNKSREIENIKIKIADINANEEEIIKLIASCEAPLLKLSKNLLKEKIENKLFNSSLVNINNYKNYLPNDIPFKHVEILEFINATNKFLEIFNVNCVTSLSAKAAFPLTTELFDIVVIDEASQCDIASAIPLILRAKHIVVIGDPMQLKHISALNKFEEDTIKEHLQLTNSVYLKYKEKSLWEYSKDFLATAIDNNVTVNIDKHYRCHPEIIGYSNEAFYKPYQLNLEICTNESQFPITPKGMIWEDVVGNQRSDKVNINDAEIVKSIEIATSIANRYPEISIGIVTPFRHQAIELFNKTPIELRKRITIDTVYKFQGDEKDVMIFSLVVTNNSPDSKIYWIDNMVPESVNVAVTRARNTIYIVGNKEYIKSKSKHTRPLKKLVEYVDRLN